MLDCFRASKAIGAVLCALLCWGSGMPAAAGSPEIFTQLGHTGSVRFAAMSRDGQYLLSTGEQGEIKLWEVRTGQEVRSYSERSGNAALAFSPDGSMFVSYCDGVIRLRDTESGREHYAIAGKDRHSKLSPLSFVADGKYFMMSGAGEPVELWETETGRAVGGLDPAAMGGGDEMLSLLLSPDGRSALSQGAGAMVGGRWTDGVCKLWNPMTGGMVKTFNRSAFFITTRFTPDGRRVLSSVNTEGRIELWDIATGATVWSVRTGHGGPVERVAMSADGRRALTTGKDDGTAKVWDVATGRMVMSMVVPKGFSATKLAPDGRTLLLLDDDRGVDLPFLRPEAAVKLVDADTGAELQTLGTRGEPRFDLVSYTPDGRGLLLLGFGQAVLWDLDTRSVRQGFEGFGKLTTGVAYSRKRDLAAVLMGPDAALWDVGAGRRLRILKGPGRFLSCAAFAPDDSALAAGSTDGTVRIWETGTGRERAVLPGHAGGTLAVTYAPDGRTLATAGKDALVKLWDARTGAPVRTFAGHVSGANANTDFPGVHAVAFAPDGRTLASGGADGAIRIWNVATGAAIRTLKGHDRDVSALAFSPDGAVLASGGADGTVRLWDPAQGRETRNLGKTTFGFVARIEYSRDGRWILSLGDDEIVRIWDAGTGQQRQRIAGPPTGIRVAGVLDSAVFSPDGRTVLGYESLGSAARIWDRAAGRELARFISFKDGEWIAMTPEGYFNASPGGARHLNVRNGLQVSSIDQFYGRFFRPGLVQLALAGQELPKGEPIPEIAARKPAPGIAVLAPAGDAAVDQDTVALSLKLTDNGGGIGTVNVYLNGALVAQETRGVGIQGKLLAFTLPLVKGINLIRAVAFNAENSMESLPAQVSVTSRAAMGKPNLHALVVGINAYRNQSISLTYAVPDALALAAALRKGAAGLFGRTDVRTLTTPEETTKAAIVQAFEAMRREVGPNDLFVFYDASHGLVDLVDGEEQYFVLTSNVRLLSSSHLGEDALSHKDLVRLIGAIPAQKKLVILDTCNAGKGGKEIQLALLQQTRGLTDATAVKLLQRAVGSSVFSASADSQQALEGYRGHGLFTYVLLEGLAGKADFRKDGFITVKGLALHTEEQVMTLSEEVFKRQQNPMIETGVNDFPIGKL